MYFGDVIDNAQAEDQSALILARKAKTRAFSPSTCDNCENPISKERIKAVPGTRLCVVCQEELELSPKKL